jgi:MFS family permease
MSSRPPESSTSPRLLTRAFVRITVAALCYFLALGVVAPVLPVYVQDSLGGGGIAVGIAVGAFAISAALLRPVVGRIGDSRGRKILLVGGTLIACVSMVGYTLATTLWILVGMRLLTGVGEAAAFVGAATAVQDLAPPTRRGEAASYFSVAVYGGLGFGPVIGEIMRHHFGVDAAWLTGAALCALGALLALGMPVMRPPASAVHTGKRKFLHPAGIRPGVILALSASGYAGFAAFVPLYVGSLGMGGAGLVFLVYSVVVLVVRIFFARLPDQLGHIRGSSLALILQFTGLMAMALWSTQVGLFVTTVVFGLGASLLYPALFPIVVEGAPEAERSHAVATFTLFFDVSQGLGAFALGILVAIAGVDQAAFAGAALLCLLGFVLMRSSAAPQNDEGRDLSEAGTH